MKKNFYNMEFIRIVGEAGNRDIAILWNNIFTMWDFFLDNQTGDLHNCAITRHGYLFRTKVC